MAVNLSPIGGVAAQFFDNSGNVLSGGKIFTYAAGTTTPQATYTSAGGGTALANPIILDAAGRVPTGEIWLTDGLQYKFIIKTSTDVQIGSYDNIVGINSNFVNYTNSQEIQTATSGQTVFTLTTMQYQPGTNSLSVFVDGVNQYGPGALYAYTETSSTVVTFTAGLHVGADVKFTTSAITSSSSSDASQVSYTAPFTGGTTTNVELKLAQTVSVEDFLPSNFDYATEDATAYIQAAISSGAKVINFGAHVYRTTSPIYIDGDISLMGQGGHSGATTILKTTATNGTGSNTARGGTVTDSYVKNAVIIFRHPDNSYTYNVTLKGLRLSSDGYLVNYGIYAPRTALNILEDVYIFQCETGWYANDAWLNQFTRVTCNSNSQRAINGGPTYGWSSNSYGFVWANDGSGLGTGTSLAATDCWARDCDYGWFIFGLSYSSFTSCAADNISRSAYYLLSSQIALNGCGLENVQINALAAIYVSSSRITFNSCRSDTIYGNTSGTAGFLFAENSSVVLNACLFEDFDVANSAFNYILQNSAKFQNNGSQLPTNGNTSVSYASGSQEVNTDNVPPYIRSEIDSTLRRYVAGRVNDDQVREVKSKAIVSAGTTIATFTVATTAGVSGAVCAFTVSWYDTAYPSAIGMDKFLVSVYQDTTGANYDGDISTVTSVVSGITGGSPTAPTYTLTRASNVFSLVMTPAHGDCTASTITAEFQNITGTTLVLT